ncbi:MAG TPA: efflux RND transporter periplasmic adaptor subunit [Terriglobia bacterium]|nr:efflux RND transporter periplasmic adaptor subunit [Terriglobia bacterium]
MKSLKLLLLFIGFTVMLSGCNGAGKTSAPEENKTDEKDNAKKAVTEVVIPVSEQTGVIEAHQAELSNETEVIRAPGKVALSDRGVWRVGVRTDGMVMVVNAALGDYVQKDQVLARYHADEVRDTRALYRTALSERERAEAAVAQAQRNFDRAKMLLDLKAGSAQQVENARQDLSKAQAEVRKAEIEIDRTKDLLEDDLRVPAEPPTNGDETADLVPIRAPAAGYIIQKNVTPGKTIDRNTDTFLIGDLSHLWVIASINEKDIGTMRVGQQATVSVTGFPDSHFSGRLANLGEEFDPVTRAMRVRIELDNPGIRLRPEMLASVQIEAGTSKPQLAVPLDAVQQVNDQDVLFIKKSDDRFEVRPVRTSEPVNGRVVVMDGLKPGEMIVTRGSFVVKSQLLKASLESE